jgi:hypothetical protein
MDLSPLLCNNRPLADSHIHSRRFEPAAIYACGGRRHRPATRPTKDR